MHQDAYPTKRENLISNWRLRKGDLDVSRDAAGYINQANVTDRTILAYLIEIRALDYGHLSAAATYALWQHAFRKPFFAEPRKIYLIELLGQSENGSFDESAYRMLLRRLDRYHQDAIERAISDDVTPSNRDGVYAARFKYLSAFDFLLRLIPQIEDELHAIHDAANKAKENACHAS